MLHRFAFGRRINSAAIAATLLLGVVAGAHAALIASEPVTALAFAPDGALVVGRSTAGVEIVENVEGSSRRARTIECGLGRVTAVALSPAGDVLAIAGGSPDDEGGFELRKISSGELVSKSLPHRDVAHAVAFSPRGSFVATAGHDRLVVVADARSGEVRERFRGHSRPVLAVEFLSEDVLVSAGADHSLRVWKLGEERATRILDQHQGAVHALALRPREDSTGPAILASAGADGTVRLWQPGIGRLVRFARLPSPPLDLAWEPDGRMIIAACRDGIVRRIDPEAVEVISEKRIARGWLYAVAASKAGGFAAGGDGGALEMNARFEKLPTPDAEGHRDESHPPDEEKVK
ncbi:MAG TPA: hypothetical protein VK116_10365 [Planctomycetota bacterium]|nr:hypothetical protein [Planctomycetota bacterium]